MTTEPTEIPPLPPALLNPVPVIVVCTVAWVLAVIAAFTIADLATWRPATVAGLGLTALGTSVFLWQRSAVRRGSRGAQSGLR